MTKNKVDLLLQKANTYEKMALFGSRKNYLSAMAQAAGAQLSSTEKQQLEGVMNNLSANRPNATDLVNRLMSHLNSPTVDLNTLSGDLGQAANAIPGDKSTEVQQALNLKGTIDQKLQSQQPASQEGEGGTIQMPADKITGYAPVPKDVQEKLSEMMSIRGDYIPFKVDGKLGPETKKALDIYQQKYNRGSKLPPGEELYNAIRKTYNFWKMDQKYQAGEQYAKPASPFKE